MTDDNDKLNDAIIAAYTKPLLEDTRKQIQKLRDEVREVWETATRTQWVTAKPLGDNECWDAVKTIAELRIENETLKIEVEALQKQLEEMRGDLFGIIGTAACIEVEYAPDYHLCREHDASYEGAGCCPTGLLLKKYPEVKT